MRAKMAHYKQQAVAFFDETRRNGDRKYSHIDWLGYREHAGDAVKHMAHQDWMSDGLGVAGVVGWSV